MQVIVHLVPDVAQEINEGNVQSATARELIGALKDLGVELRPVHPGSLDPALAATFFVEAKDLEDAQKLAARLQALGGTTAAYVKPPPAMP
jgi:hypothetical protein